MPQSPQYPALGIAGTHLHNTSLLATAFQYWEYTAEPVALVLSNGWGMQSFRPFRTGWPRIRFGEIHEHSAAGERLAGKSADCGRMVRIPSYAWLEGFDYKPDTDIMEDSLYLEYYDRTVTLLWIDEPLSVSSQQADTFCQSTSNGRLLQSG